MEIARVHTEAANLCHVRSGTVTEFVLYRDSAHELGDLGLKE